MRQVIAGLAMIGLLAAQAAAAPVANEKPLKAGVYSATAKALVCSACAERIEKTLKTAPGIEAVSVSQETSAVRFTVKRGATVKLGTLQTARGFERYGENFVDDMWVTVRSVAEHVVEHWREPDRGIWEVRGPERHFVYSKAMCWVALDRAVRLAKEAGRLAGRLADALDGGSDRAPSNP